MLTSIDISGFKSISHLSSPLELGAVNVFIGANGSGKSNILEAIGVLSAAANGQVDDQSLLNRGVRPGTPALFKTAIGKFPRYIDLSAKGDFDGRIVDYRVNLDNPIKSPESTWRYATESLHDGQQAVLGRSGAGAKLGNQTLRRKPNVKLGIAEMSVSVWENSPAPFELIEALRNYAIYSPTTPVLRGVAPDSEQRSPVGLSGGRLAEAVSDVLSNTKGIFGEVDLDKVLELLDWVSTIDITAPSKQIQSTSVPTLNRVVRFTDRYMRSTRNHLTGFDASEGALYVLFALILLVHPESPKFFAIDNFDQALNPLLARRLMKFFADIVVGRSKDKQVLLTTHNPVVLDGLDIRNDAIRLFAVQRARSGATTVKRIRVSEKILDAIGEGTALSTLWITGRLGAVPNL